MTIVRNNQLIEEELSPTTPNGAKTLGASADSAKMTGSSAQKSSAIKQAIAPEQQQSKVERYKTPSTTTTEVQSQKSSLGDRLQRVGGLNDRVDNLIAQRMEAAAGVQSNLVVSEELTSTLNPEAKSAVDAYMLAVQDPNADTSAAYEVMATAIGSSVPNPEQYLQSVRDTLGQSFETTANISENPTLGELSNEGETLEQTLGYEGNLAEDLGVDANELNDLTIEQIQQQIQAIKEEEFGRVDSIKAEMINASPDRRAELLSELRTLGAVGETGVEVSVSDLSKQIEQADVIDFAGESRTIGDLLDSDAISNAIKFAVDSDDELEKLRESEPALAEWVENNKGKLKSLFTDINVQSGEFQALQQEFTEATAGVDEGLLQNILGVDAAAMQFVSQSEFDKYIKAAESSSLFKVAKENPTIGAALADVMKSDPDAFDELQNLDPEELTLAHEMANRLKEPGSVQDIMGEFEGSFVTDSDTIKQYNEVSNIVSTLDKYKAITEGNSEFIGMVRDGIINQEEAEYIAKNGKKEFDDLATWYRDDKQLKEAKDTEDLIAQIFGEEYNTDTINEKMKMLKPAAQWGNPEAAKQLKLLESYFGTNGADEQDFKGLRGKLKGMLGKNAIDSMSNNSNLNKTKGMAGDSLKAQSMTRGMTALKSFFETDKYQNYGKPTQRLADLMEDGKIDSIEARSLPQHVRDELRASGDMSEGVFQSVNKHILNVKAKAVQKKQDAIVKKEKMDNSRSVKLLNSKLAYDPNKSEGAYIKELTDRGINDNVAKKHVRRFREAAKGEMTKYKSKFPTEKEIAYLQSIGGTVNMSNRLIALKKVAPKYITDLFFRKYKSHIQKSSAATASNTFTSRYS